MNSLLKNAFKQQVEAKIGSNFEEFIDTLFLLKYGPDNYTPIRGTNDQGNDGTVLIEDKILACYAPKKYNKTEFENKVNGTAIKQGDFPKYVANWKSQYSNWEMLVNHEVSPDQLKLIEKLDGNTSLKGVTQILSIIENDLTTNQRRKLANFLEIGDYIKQDYISDILQDLLNNTEVGEGVLKFNRRSLTDITDKIALNFAADDIDGIKSEIALVMLDFDSIAKLLAGYEDSEKDLIKWRVIHDLNKLSGNFKTRINNLTEQYTKEYGNIDDDGYRKNVSVVLYYMFEQCLIGKKTKPE